MYVLSEKSIKKIVDEKMAYDAVAEAFIAAYKKEGNIYPVVHAEGCEAGNTFSIKSGNLLNKRISGFKSGSYWANNHLKGIPNHGTTTILLNEETGFVNAILNAGYLNGLRTAAANAVASDLLAREDVTTLGVLGAGHQAIFEIKSLLKIRDLKKILIHSRNKETALNAVCELKKEGIVAHYESVENVCCSADILVTVTNSCAPLFEKKWVKPGTHISAMGADKSGKQELPIDLVSGATLFADHPPQSIINGEFEAAFGESPSLKITSIGAVLAGDESGRANQDQITIFDSSGIALQDLCIAKLVLDFAIQKGLVEIVDF